VSLNPVEAFGLVRSSQ